MHERLSTREMQWPNILHAALLGKERQEKQEEKSGARRETPVKSQNVFGHVVYSKTQAPSNLIKTQ